MKKALILATISFFIHLHSFAQEAKDQDRQPFIEVVGTAEKEVMPDLIYITIILKDKTINKHSLTINEQEVKLKNILEKLNIDFTNLMLSDASSDLIIHKKKEKGVEEIKEYVLKVETAAKVSQVFEEFHNNEIKEAYISSTECSKIAEYRKEVRIGAVKAAKDKAAYLLEAIGEELGKPIEIREIENNYGISTNSFKSNIALNEGAAIPDSSFKKIKIKFSYYIRYTIK